MTIRPLIVDDHAVVRQGLRLLLEAQPDIEVVGEAADGEMAIQSVSQFHPDVILMDLLMPEMSGTETIRRINDLRPESKILVLTSSLEDEMVKQALQAGARGYILKACRSSELVEAIRRVAQGLPSLDSAAAQVFMHQVQSQDPMSILTGREREIFDAMARGLNNSEIAQQLNVTEATVRTHVASVLEKLALRDRTQVMIYPLKKGLVHIEDLR